MANVGRDGSSAGRYHLEPQNIESASGGREPALSGEAGGGYFYVGKGRSRNLLRAPGSEIER
jgi:hypothetical protein